MGILVSKTITLWFNRKLIQEKIIAGDYCCKFILALAIDNFSAQSEACVFRRAHISNQYSLGNRIVCRTTIRTP